MKVIHLLAVLAVLATGCSHKHYLTSFDSVEYRALADRAERSWCIIALEDGTTCEAENLEVRVDRTSFRVHPTGEPIHVNTHEVESITFLDRPLGALEGGGFGLVVGAGIGAIVGLATASDSNDGCEICITRGGIAAMGALIAAPIGAVVGAAIGSGGGARDIYYPYSEDSVRASADSVTKERSR